MNQNLLLVTLLLGSADAYGAICSPSGFSSNGGRIRTIYAAMSYPGPDAMLPSRPPHDGHYPVK